MTKNEIIFLSIVAYLRHVGTVTSKHAPAITQQYTKRCILRAVLRIADLSRRDPSREWVAIRVVSPHLLLPGNRCKHLEWSGKGWSHVTAPAVTSCPSNKTTIESVLPVYQLQGFIRVRNSKWSASSWQLSVAGSHGEFIVEEELEVGLWRFHSAVPGVDW
jgi:hypothetical protein